MLVSLTAFVLLSVYLFYKTSYAAYIYAFAAVVVLSKWSERDRNDLLKAMFPKRSYYQVRVIENVAIALPFLIGLACQGKLIVLVGLVLAAVLMSFLKFEDRLNFTIPTPFSRYPFEYTAGFRQALWVYALAYFLAFKSMQVSNFGLGIFSLTLVFLVGMSHYLKPEEKYFVWIYAASSKGFLAKKVGVALLFATGISLPIVLFLIFSFPDNWAIFLGIQGLGYLFLLTMVLAKYAAFPGELNLPQGILFSLCFGFPPMLLVIIPIFYNQAIKRLDPILK